MAEKENVPDFPGTLVECHPTIRIARNLIHPRIAYTARQSCVRCSSSLASRRSASASPASCLLAAACFARSYRPFHEWLLAHRQFGPMIHEWQVHGSIPYRTKITAIVMMAVTLGVSVVFFVRPLWLQAALAVFGLGLAAWMYRLPSRDK
jgi:uncharacterized membrane protein YbaN (DUF454 family)